MRCFVNPIDGAIVGEEFHAAIAPSVDAAAVRRALVRRAEAWAALEGARVLSILEVAGACLRVYQALGYEMAPPKYHRLIA